MADNTSIQANGTRQEETKPHDWLNKNIGKMKIEKICIHKILQWVLKGMEENVMQNIWIGRIWDEMRWVEDALTCESQADRKKLCA